MRRPPTHLQGAPLRGALRPRASRGASCITPPRRGLFLGLRPASGYSAAPIPLDAFYLSGLCAPLGLFGAKGAL
eukprot:996473-Alexandrium_andersonii.AAC.1